jgi:hypothetical protein
MVVIGSSIEDRRKFIENEKYLERKESPGNDLNGEIEFELYRLHGVWFPRLTSKTDVCPFDVLPLTLIRYISEKGKQDDTFLKKPVQVPGFPPVLLSFTKIRDDLINGIIQRIKTDGKEIENVESISVGHLPERNKQDELRIYLEYLLTNEPFYNHTIAEFFFKWKPLIDQKFTEMSG